MIIGRFPPDWSTILSGGRLGAWQRAVQPYVAADAGYQRSGHDAEFGHVEQAGLCRRGKRKACYEQRYGEPDAAQHGYASHHVPVGIVGHGGYVKFDRTPGEEEDAEKLACNKAYDYGKRYAAEQRRQVHAAECDARIGESEQRHDEVVDKRVKRVLEVLERRDDFCWRGVANFCRAWSGWIFLKF